MYVVYKLLFNKGYYLVFSSNYEHDLRFTSTNVFAYLRRAYIHNLEKKELAVIAALLNIKVQFSSKRTNHSLREKLSILTLNEHIYAKNIEEDKSITKKMLVNAIVNKLSLRTL